MEPVMSNLPFWQSCNQTDTNRLGSAEGCSADPTAAKNQAQEGVTVSRFSVTASPAGGGASTSSALAEAASPDSGVSSINKKPIDDVDEAIRELSAEIGQLMQG
jgi:hypothetical protein